MIKESHHLNLRIILKKMANVTGDCVSLRDVDHQVVKGQEHLILLTIVRKEMISGGNIDYKGVNPGENPPYLEVFSKWGWTTQIIN